LLLIIMFKVGEYIDVFPRVKRHKLV